jgi:CRP/FNR family transcriptional regulator
MQATQLTAAPAAGPAPRRPLASVQSQPATVQDILQLMGASDLDVTGAVQFPAPIRRLHAGEVLFHEGAPSDAIYFVRAGTFKISCTAEDGYEQVLGFAGRTEVLGFDAICMDAHPTAAVALEDSSVYTLSVKDIYVLGQRVPALDRVLHRATSQALAYRGQVTDVMAAVAAEVRLARFLVQWSQRMAACGQSPRRFHLRMSRRDIASHLGVAHETVSRSFGALVGWGYLKVANRDVEIVDPDGLRAFARSTRRPHEDRGGMRAATRSVLHAAA